MHDHQAGGAHEGAKYSLHLLERVVIGLGERRILGGQVKSLDFFDFFYFLLHLPRRTLNVYFFFFDISDFLFYFFYNLRS